MIEDAKDELGGDKNILGANSIELSATLRKHAAFTTMLEKGVAFSYAMQHNGQMFLVAVTPIFNISGHYAAALISFIPSKSASKFELKKAYGRLLTLILSSLTLSLSTRTQHSILDTRPPCYTDAADR
jgi:hypothetical protein